MARTEIRFVFPGGPPALQTLRDEVGRVLGETPELERASPVNAALVDRSGRHAAELTVTDDAVIVDLAAGGPPGRFERAVLTALHALGGAADSPLPAASARSAPGRRSWWRRLLGR